MFYGMKDHFTKEKIRYCALVGGVLAVVAVLAAFDIYKCPLDFLFGIPCPLCGMTRALLSVLKGDIAGAFYYHPLWPVAVLAAIAYILYFFEFIRISKKIFNIILIVLSACFVICFIYRHLTGSPVVRTHFDCCFFSGILR